MSLTNPKQNEKEFVSLLIQAIQELTEQVNDLKKNK